jgi:hypothetical protein
MYVIYTAFLPLFTTRIANSEENKSSSKVNTLGQIFFLCWRIPVSQVANSGNVEKPRRPSIGSWFVPIPTPPSQGKVSGTLAR